VDDILLFELHDWLSDLRDILIKYFSLQDGEELRVIIHDGLPVGFSNGVTFAFSVSSMDEDLSLVETDIECTDDCVLSKS
jgi:hypothetical protein